MSASTKRLTRVAALSALSVAVLFIASVLPSAKLALTAIAGLFPAVTLMMYGFGWSLFVYAAGAILSLLILPTKGIAVLFAAFFGFYPLMKALFERYINKDVFCWLTKCVLFSIVFWVWWFIPSAFGLALSVSVPWYLLWPLGVAVFAVYDICFSCLIKLYIERISGYFT